MNIVVRQSCVMSPWLLYLCMYKVVREMQERTVVKGAQLVGDGEEKGEVSHLLFINDKVLVANSKRMMIRLVEEFGRVCRRRKLKVNVAKSKVMRSARDCIIREKIS